MKKSKVFNTRWLCLMMVGGALLAGCTEDKYDLSDIDLTLGLGGQSLQLPIGNSTADMILDDLLDLGDGSLIQVNDNGDYVLSKKPDNPQEITVHIDEVREYDLPSVEFDPVEVTMPNIPGVIPSQTIPITTFARYDYDYGVPDDVKSLSWMNTNLSAQIRLDFRALREVNDMKIIFPKYVTIKGYNSNEISVPHVNGGSLYYLDLIIEKVELKKESDTDFAIIDESNPNDRRLKASGDVKISGMVTTGTAYAGQTLTIGGGMDMKHMQIQEVSGKFDPNITITEEDLGTVTITDIPEFLTDEEVTVDLYNMKVNLDITTDLPVETKVGGTLTSINQKVVYSGNDRIVLPASVYPETQQKLVILSNKTVSDAPTGVQVIVKPELSKLVSKLQEGMTISFKDITAKANSNQECVVKLGHDYHVTVVYGLEAPLAFGSDMEIVYTTTEGGMNETTKDMSLPKETYVEITGNASNGIPAYLTLKVEFLDINGNVLTDMETSEVSVKPCTVKEDGTIEPVVTPFNIEARDVSGTSFNKVESIRLRAEAKAKGTDGKTIEGITLNKLTQKVKLTDFNATIVGKVIYDAN